MASTVTLVTLVGGWHQCAGVIAYYKIELRLGVQRKMMFSEIIAIIQAMNYLFGGGVYLYCR